MVNREPDGEGKIILRGKGVFSEPEAYIGAYWFTNEGKTVTVLQYDVDGGKYEIEVPLSNIHAIKRKVCK